MKEVDRRLRANPTTPAPARCGAPGLYYDDPAQPMQCELAAGHKGDHRSEDMKVRFKRNGPGGVRPWVIVSTDQADGRVSALDIRLDPVEPWVNTTWPQERAPRRRRKT